MGTPEIIAISASVGAVLGKLIDAILSLLTSKNKDSRTIQERMEHHIDELIENYFKVKEESTALQIKIATLEFFLEESKKQVARKDEEIEELKTRSK